MLVCTIDFKSTSYVHTSLLTITTSTLERSHRQMSPTVRRSCPRLDLPDVFPLAYSFLMQSKGFRLLHASISKTTLPSSRFAVPHGQLLAGSLDLVWALHFYALSLYYPTTTDVVVGVHFFLQLANFLYVRIRFCVAGGGGSLSTMTFAAADILLCIAAVRHGRS